MAAMATMSTMVTMQPGNTALRPCSSPQETKCCTQPMQATVHCHNSRQVC